MFDDTRPARMLAKIWVATYDTERMVCARCTHETFARDVAMYTRTRPGDPFDPWCHECALVLIRWAGVGALEVGAMDSAEAEQRLREAMTDGSL